MLSQLIIKNFAIIDEVEINFKEGLTVITGETGAGKSIIADAIDFLLGIRASSDLIKNGANKATVEGVFIVKSNHELPQEWLTENGFESENKTELTLSRELTSQGSKVRINGSLASVSHLNTLRNFLVEIHKQSEHIDLLKVEKQLEILDGFGDEKHKALLESYKINFSKYENLKIKLKKTLEESDSMKKKIDFLEHEIKEIKDADIKNTNEDEELKTKREILLNKKELIENTNLIHELLNNDNGLLQTITQIKKLLRKNSDFDKSFEAYFENIESSISEIKDLSSFVSSYSDNLGNDEENLEEIEEKLDIFYNLKKKYGGSLEEVLKYGDRAKNELAELNKSSISKDDLERTLLTLEKEVNDLGDKLTLSREKITKLFVDSINEELKSLGFQNVLFIVEFTKSDASINGKEQIQFLFSANPDELPKPLLKVASGGELSRIMLAIKSCTCSGEIKRESASTMIFDEVDVGVSGEIAASVAKKLYKISGKNQIICITHQPIIAAMADNYCVTVKKFVDGNTTVLVKEVDNSEKAEAIACLLTPEKGLKGVSADAISYANSLIENAKKIKEKKIYIHI